VELINAQDSINSILFKVDFHHALCAAKNSRTTVLCHEREDDDHKWQEVVHHRGVENAQNFVQSVVETNATSLFSGDQFIGFLLLF
jgi:hypothetical protein